MVKITKYCCFVFCVALVPVMLRQISTQSFSRGRASPPSTSFLPTLHHTLLLQQVSNLRCAHCDLHFNLLNLSSQIQYTKIKWKTTVVFICLMILLSGTLDSNSNSSESSIMSFLSAMESRSLQAGPVSASLLSSYRPPSWPVCESPSIFFICL